MSILGVKNTCCKSGHTQNSKNFPYFIVEIPTHLTYLVIIAKEVKIVKVVISCDILPVAMILTAVTDALVRQPF